MSLLHSWQHWCESHRIQFSNNGDSVAIACFMNVYLYSVKTGQRLGTFLHREAKSQGEYRLEGVGVEGGATPVYSIRFSSDGQFLVTSTYWDNIIRFWDIKTGNVMRRLECNVSHGFPNFSLSADGKYLASGSQATEIWDLNTGNSIFEIPTAAESLAFSPDSKLLAIETTSGPIELLETDHWTLVERLERVPQSELESNSGWWSTAFSSSGTSLMSVRSQVVDRWELNIGDQQIDAGKVAGSRKTMHISPRISETYPREFGFGSVCSDWITSSRLLELYSLTEEQPLLMLSSKNDFLRTNPSCMPMLI